jgi:YaaC-like Protein
MITKVRRIRAVSATAEVWKYLRFFLSTEKTTAQIRATHKIPLGEQDGNLQKQARQIAYSIRQAEQYFRASSLVDLTTRPLLIYYGAVALSQALILIKNDGTFSLDSLRKERKHRHHGLELHANVESASKATSFCQFWETVTCSVHRKASGDFWGHFPLLYKSLDPDVFSCVIQIQDLGQTSHLTREIVMTSADLRPLDSVAAEAINAYELLKTLPDVHATMIELGQISGLRPGNINRNVVTYYKPMSAENSNKEIDRVVDTSHFFVDSIGREEQNELFTFYQTKNPLITKQSDYERNLYLTLEKVMPSGTPHSLGYHPDIVEDVFGKKFYILEPEKYVPETAAFAVLLFALGMISRYYPDVWVKNIDANIEMAEVTNAFLNIAFRKFPNLILDQMTGIKHVIED